MKLNLKINLKRINKERQNRVFRVIVLTFIYFMIFLSIYKSNISDKDFLYSILFFIAIIHISYVIHSFKEKFKQTIYYLYQYLGYRYFPKEYINQSEFFITPFYKGDYDEYKGKDLIVSKNFKVSFVEILKKQRRMDSQGRIKTYKTPVFSGYVYIFKTNLNVNSPILITKNRFHLEEIMPILIEKERVKLDFPQFEEYFDVYSKDKIETNLILTHEFMEKILKNRYILKIDKFYFIKNKLYAYFKSSNITNKINFYTEITKEDIEKILFPFILGKEVEKLFK